MGMVGAGRLASMIWKDGDEQLGWRYRFNVFRTQSRGGRVSQLFTPADVIHLVKLAQVLAAVISDDGCLDPIERGVLKRLADDLDEFWAGIPKTQRRAQGNGPSLHRKGTSNGDSTDA